MQIIEIDEFEAIKSKLARSLKETLTREAAAPQGERPVDYEVHIPYHQIKQDPSVHIPDAQTSETPKTASAVVTYIVRCPTEKKHTVKISFEYDKSGRFIRNTMRYV
jgi:hypothetical protein